MQQSPRLGEDAAFEYHAMSFNSEKKGMIQDTRPSNREPMENITLHARLEGAKAGSRATSI